MNNQDDELFNNNFGQFLESHGVEIIGDRPTHLGTWRAMIDLNELKAAILAWHNRHLSEIERAYGGCHNCYGKGYSTVKSQTTGYGTDGDIGGFEGPIKIDKPIEIKYCDCDRARQLERAVIEARIDEINYLDDNYQEDSQWWERDHPGYSTPMIPMEDYIRRRDELTAQLSKSKEEK